MEIFDHLAEGNSINCICVTSITVLLLAPLTSSHDDAPITLILIFDSLVFAAAVSNYSQLMLLGHR